MCTDSREIEIYKDWRIHECRKDKRYKPIYIAYFQKYTNQMPEMLDANTLEALKEKIDNKAKRKVLYRWK